MVDYYKVLGVPRGASSEEIKAAFRRQALKFHPDRHANATKSEQSRAAESFRQVMEAYEALSGDKSKLKRPGSASGSQYGSSSGSTWSNTSYSSRSGFDGSYEKGYRQWYEQRGSSTGENFRAEWTYRTSESSGNYDGKHYYHRTVRWNWPPPPSQGPSFLVRAAFVGFAAITLLIVNSIFKPRSIEFRKSYDEMYERVQQEKRLRENKQGEAQPTEWDSGWEDSELKQD